jgi:hypothetical protein
VIKDPWTVWSGPFPYDVLAPAGVTPNTSHRRMQEIPLTPETRQALEELRSVRRRLLVDLVLYPVDAEAELAHVERELATPGEPLEVAEALEFRPSPPQDWAEELGELDLPEPQEVPSYAEFDSVMLDELIRFDR